MVRSWRSKKAQEKSPRVLILVEYAARRSVAPISSVIASSALRITSKRTGSTSAGNALAGRCGVDRDVWTFIYGPRAYECVRRSPSGASRQSGLLGYTRPQHKSQYRHSAIGWHTQPAMPGVKHP